MPETQAPPEIQKVLADPNFLKLSGSDQVAVLKHIRENAPPPAQANVQPDLSGQNMAMTRAMSGQPQETPSQQADFEQGLKAGTKAGAVTVGASVAPALAPAAEGTGFLKYLWNVISRAGVGGGTTGLGNAAGQAITGQNPFSEKNLLETAKTAGITAGVAVPFEALGQLSSLKTGRALINQSMNASVRDVTYANPARALLTENITDVPTGDLNAYQLARRAGKSIPEAAQAAGGRFAAVSQRINELAHQSENILSQSTAKIPVQNVIVKPLEDAAYDILSNRAIGESEKNVAIAKLSELEKSMTEGLGPEATPAQLQHMKQELGNRVNWTGNSAVTDDVKGAYRALYGSMKNAIHAAVPQVATIDNRLSDLMAASNDLETLVGAEEVRRGVGGLSLGERGIRAAEKTAGRVLPATVGMQGMGVPTGASIAEQLQSKGQQQPNSPTLPFHPGAGLQKP